MMSQQTPSQQTPRATTRPGSVRKFNRAAVGMTAFAGIMMIMLGTFQLVAGVSALLHDAWYLSTRAWLFELDSTRWGWIHLALGLLLIAAGMMLFGGMIWARIVAVIVASVSAIANFVWLPWYPVWGTLMIALDVCIIWAVTVHGRDITRV